jgi:anaerobic selenocysteine-containing dehydrogenase
VRSWGPLTTPSDIPSVEVPAYAGTIRRGMGARDLSSGRRPPPLEILDILNIPEKNGLDYSMKEISRRTFLKLAGVSAAAAALYQSSGSILAALNVMDQETPPGEGKWIPSVCQLCPAECGLRVRVVGDVAVKIEGNHQNPSNQGRTCPKGQVGLHLLYNPDRVRTPLKRVGERGEGQWQAISWDEAIGAVASQLVGLRTAGTPERLAFLYERPAGLLEESIAHFCRAMGTPNVIDMRPDALSKAVLLTQGWDARPGYDLERTRHLLSFGYALLESAQPSVHLLSTYSFMRRGRPGDRAHIVQIEPRLSVTAIKADEWVPIKPGTEGVLALGLAWVILSEHLYDEAFVTEYCHGFEEWSQAVLQDYAPERVASLTGVDERTITRLAREFADTSPAASQLAIHSLNALVGSIDVPGGVMIQRPVPLTPWPDVSMDGVTTQGLGQPRLDGPERYPLGHSVVHHLPEAILSSDPYPLEALLLYRANPIHELPDREAWQEALKQVPLIVSFDSFVEETSAYADYILPDHTFLERWIAAPLMPSLGYPVLAFGQPVVEPLYDTRALGDVLIQLAHQVGGAPRESFPWSDYLGLLRFRLEDLVATGYGRSWQSAACGSIPPTPSLGETKGSRRNGRRCWPRLPESSSSRPRCSRSNSRYRHPITNLRATWVRKTSIRFTYSSIR